MENSFPQFAYLPGELQSAVWEQAMPTETRVFTCVGLRNLEGSVAPIPVSHSRFSFSDSIEVDLLQMRLMIRVQHPVPSILQVCQVSRRVAKDHYFFLFGRFWFNPRLDIIYFSTPFFGFPNSPLPTSPPVHVPDLERVRHVALSHCFWGFPDFHAEVERGWCFYPLVTGVSTARMYFPRLKTLSMVLPVLPMDADGNLLDWRQNGHHLPSDTGHRQRAKPTIKVFTNTQRVVVACESYQREPFTGDVRRMTGIYGVRVQELLKLWHHGAYFCDCQYHRSEVQMMPEVFEEWDDWRETQCDPEVEHRVVELTSEGFGVPSFDPGELERQDASRDEWIAARWIEDLTTRLRLEPLSILMDLPLACERLREIDMEDIRALT